MEIALTELD